MLYLENMPTRVVFVRPVAKSWRRSLLSVWLKSNNTDDVRTDVFTTETKSQSVRVTE